MQKLWKVSVVLCFLVLILLPGNVGLAHNAYGVTGLINIPTASVLSSGSMSIGYSAFRGGHYASVILGAFPNVEVGLASDLSSKNPSFLGSAKVKILNEADYPAVAVGLTADGNHVNYYLVCSMQVGFPGVRGHIGFGTGRYKSGFAGISSVLNPVSISTSNKRFTLPVTTVLIEYDGSGLNTGLSFKFNQKLESKIIVSDFNQIGFAVNYSHTF